ESSVKIGRSRLPPASTICRVISRICGPLSSDAWRSSRSTASKYGPRSAKTRSTTCIEQPPQFPPRVQRCRQTSRSDFADVERANAPGQVVIAHVAEAELPHHGGQRLLIGESQHRLGQITIRIGIALDQPADPRPHIAKVKQVNLAEPGPSGPGKLKPPPAAAGTHTPRHP